jgi:6-phosphogluconate dehydrogenase
MRIGVIGLGRMGYAIAKRIADDGHIVFGFDVDKKAVERAQEIGVHPIARLEHIAQEVDVLWLMLPAGRLIDDTLDVLIPRMHADGIIIDGGNSYFKDSIRRAERLATQKIFFLDCGTSGGLQGEHIGFSLMIGGNEVAYRHAEPVFQAVAMKNGYELVGPSGTGHYVKMVHNGIEYALLQAYAEGFQLIKQGHFKDTPIDLAKLAQVWQHGAIIRSYILELAQHVFEENQQFDDISGEVAEGGTGAWTVQEAIEQQIRVPLIEQALKERAVSRVTGGSYATKLIALLRNAFGGHPFNMIQHSENER